ncbi:hypothetical protein [Deinococcus knuensis]|uniref:Uncharacterized protein n=1 Tax=Deinococcus knuensis TaxID=1837380 RepID=A0ABQ2SMS1_9DEIO|nr:hypothetical protein [Deinococcus knuensis]GGS34550.1 hypothetical protein GCM10008961_27880 [Deinococcus knuensis]
MWKKFKAYWISEPQKLDYIYRLSKFKTAQDVKGLSTPALVKLFFYTRRGSLDTKASVYAFDSTNINLARIKAEHTAHAEMNPEAKGAVEISRFFNHKMIEENSDGGYFEFRSSHHYQFIELDLDSAAKISLGVIENSPRSISTSTVKDIYTYSASAYLGEHGQKIALEWANACAKSDKVNKWVKTAISKSKKI